MVSFLSGLLSAVFLFTPPVGTMPCRGQDAGLHWYCAHVKDHKQPSVAPELAFVEEYDGYYIDHKHSDSDAQEKVIYLTFDAGYENGNVEKILDVLKKEEVRAAFFILENLVTRNTELVERMAQEGHLVCNHTASHKNMSAATEEDFLAELRALETVYQEKTGNTMERFYRPPEGAFSKENLDFARKNGYQTIFWSFAYPDWDNGRQPDPERAKRMILDNVHNGEVMLLHPTSSVNAAILGNVITQIKAQGYRFGTLYELTGRAEARSG